MKNAYAIPGLKSKDELVTEIVAEIWQIPKEALLTKTRKREVVEARQVLMAHKKKETGNSLAKVGRSFLKDHATVLHAIKTVKNLRETDKAFRRKYDTFIERANRLKQTK
jgi:chromosomal replication initiator protein